MQVDRAMDECLDMVLSEAVKLCSTLNGLRWQHFKNCKQKL